MMLALAPAFINMGMGLPAFGYSHIGRAISIVQVWIIMVLFIPNFLYAVMPMMFFWNQRRVDAYLYGMLVGDLAVQAIWPPVCNLHSPRIDGSMSRNITAWSALQRCIRGSHFAMHFQQRFNFYRIVTFSLLIVDSLVHGRASALYPDMISIGSKIASTLRLLTLTFAVVVELGLGMMVNNFALRHVAYISKLRTSNASMAAITRRESEADELLRTEHLLDIASQEIMIDVQSAPLTVAFLKAEIGRVSLLLSVVVVVIYEDVKAMQALLGIDA